MKPELLIWDWNGTILDDTEACRLIADKMLTERGLKPFESLEEYREVFAFPIKEYYAKRGYTYEKETYEQVADEFVILYAEAFKAIPLMAGALETLSTLKAAGYRQVLLSATKRTQLLEQVACFPALAPFFTDILGIEDHYAFSKAHLAADFIASCGLSPDRALFIGDTDHDCEVATSVGAPCLHIAQGHQSAERLQATGSLAVLSDIRAVPGFLNR